MSNKEATVNWLADGNFGGGEKEEGKKQLKLTRLRWDANFQRTSDLARVVLVPGLFPFLRRCMNQCQPAVALLYNRTDDPRKLREERESRLEEKRRCCWQCHRWC